MRFKKAVFEVFFVVFLERAGVGAWARFFVQKWCWLDTWVDSWVDNLPPVTNTLFLPFKADFCTENPENAPQGHTKNTH